MTDFQWWQIIIALAGLGVTLGLGVFGKGFAKWADQLREMSKDMDNRLNTMTERDDRRWREMQEQIALQVKDVHQIRIGIERRVTRLETMLENK